jgi:hypothetical protein
MMSPIWIVGFGVVMILFILLIFFDDWYCRGKGKDIGHTYQYYRTIDTGYKKRYPNNPYYSGWFDWKIHIYKCTKCGKEV